MPKHTEDLKKVYFGIEEIMTLIESVNSPQLVAKSNEIYTRIMAALGRIQESDKNSD